jgi:hypothetical protein
MPHAIFFTRKGHAIHGTEETKKLGRPASHGCVRLTPENARTLFALVKENGLENTEIVLSGSIPSEEMKAARQIKPAKKAAKIGLNKRNPGGKESLARSTTKRQEESKRRITAKQQKTAKRPVKPPKKFVGPKFYPYAIGAPRRLSRREWLRLYYSGQLPMLPPPGYAPRPRLLPRY